MAKIETIPFTHGDNDSQAPHVPQNYTYVSGIYQPEAAPQFSNAMDNVHHTSVEMLKAEQAYLQQQSLRFFRIL